MLPNFNLFHLTLLVALLFVGDWMTPSYRAHPFHRGGRVTTVQLYPSTYHYISYFALRYLIWSSFQYLILTCNLFQHTCFSCLKSTFFILSYQLHCCWLDDSHPFPGPTHSTGGRGVDVMTMTMAGGVGGGPGTWNIYAVWRLEIGGFGLACPDTLKLCQTLQSFAMVPYPIIIYCRYLTSLMISWHSTVNGTEQLSLDDIFSYS